VLRAAKARTKDALDRAIAELLRLLTADDAKAWFRVPFKAEGGASNRLASMFSINIIRDAQSNCIPLCMDHLSEEMHTKMPRRICPVALKRHIQAPPGAGYLDDGHLEIDNNAAKRALRAVAIGRKNYLFVGADSGGQRAASLRMAGRNTPSKHLMG
jgi:hypothetical protein